MCGPYKEVKRVKRERKREREKERKIEKEGGRERERKRKRKNGRDRIKRERERERQNNERKKNRRSETRTRSYVGTGQTFVSAEQAACLEGNAVGHSLRALLRKASLFACSSVGGSRRPKECEFDLSALEAFSNARKAMGSFPNHSFSCFFSSSSLSFWRWKC